MYNYKIRSTVSKGIFSAALFASLSLFGCGGELPGDVSVTFKVAETTLPTVSATSPANATTDVAPNSSVSATFSKAIDNSTLNAASFTLQPSAGGAAVIGAISVSGATATFTPSSGLTGNTQYMATISANVSDTSGNTMAANYTWQFTTSVASDTTPPTVSNNSPARNATNVAPNASLAATFSEAMTNSTLNTASFILIPYPGGAPIAGSVNVSGNTATFTPKSSLAGNTKYRATITTAAADAAGNTLASNYNWKFTTSAAADLTPPTVSSTTPVNNASGISVNDSVSATFSEAMTNSTLNTSSFTLRPTSGGAAVTGTVNVSANTATFTPTTDLANNTQYTATISNAVKDAAGNALASIYNWQFTTGVAADSTAPTVSSTSPDSDATGLALNSSVNATFSEAMTNSTLNNASFTLKIVGGADVAGTVDVSGKTSTFTPDLDLVGSTEYRARITTAAKDAAGNSMQSNYTWRFTTAAAPDATPPTVVSTSPTNGVNDVALGTTISAIFSEAMNNASLTNASFTLREAKAGGASVVGTVNVSGKTATFTPTASLAANTEFTATITTAASDAAGNALAANYSWNFTTGLAAPSGTAKLTWDPVIDSNLDGYRVYYGTSPGKYLQPLGAGISVGNVTTYTLSGLTSGTRYYFAVTSVDKSSNESAYSDEVSMVSP